MAPEAKGVVEERNVGDKRNQREQGCDRNTGGRVHHVLAVVRYSLLEQCLEFRLDLRLLE